MSRVKAVAALLAGLVIAPAGGALAFQYLKNRRAGRRRPVAGGGGRRSHQPGLRRPVVAQRGVRAQGLVPGAGQRGDHEAHRPLDRRPRPITLRAAVAAAAPRPVLLIAAGQVEEEAKAAEAIRKGSPGTVAAWVVPGSGHTGLRAEPAEWERRVVSFFDAALVEEANGQQQEVQ